MKKTRTTIEVSKLQLNKGQLEWLPKNPRQWTQKDLDLTKQSITEDEDFLEDRPLLITPHGKKYLVFAGNLRTTALNDLGIKTTPAVVYEPETEEDRQTIIRRAMKDNGSFGSWDFDTLANEWDSLPLADWGVPVWGMTEDDQTEGLPPELDGVDMNPDKLEKQEGNNSDENERVIIVFKAEQKDELARLLGLVEIDKIIYDFDELSFNNVESHD